MKFARDTQGAEMSEVIAGLVAVLAAGIVAINIAMGGLQTAATKIQAWVTNLTIAAPKTS
jgi:hypothetical protein